jgi:putative endonuclease
MKYVYSLQSVADPLRPYTGITGDLRERLSKHKRGEVTHTRKFAPWTVQNYFAFQDDTKAHAFETYFKSGSGRAFAKKHF